ncbi:hypothetical protein ACIRJM_23205 [Streptomyces sp. NPDC102405]|uniref:hypothetical protein n=1 Tax=Streptomyces sp. NPDC102405 TaxID=3366170 RepID=UPI003810D4D7
MSTDHRAEAERLLASADTALAAAFEATLPIEDQQHAAVLTGILTNRAIGHALVANGQTASADESALRAALIVWRSVVSHAVAWNIAFSETDEQHEQWTELASQLARAGLDITADVDAITPGFGKDPQGVWKPPTVQREDHLRWCAEMPTPWSSKTEDTTEQ